MSNNAVMTGVALPAAAVALLHVSMLVAAGFGNHPFWRIQAINLSEAAALHDAGEVVRLIAYGHDPNRGRNVRAGFIRQDVAYLTPLEAAVAENRPEMLALLLRHGALLEPVTWTRLRCFAERLDAADTLRFLETLRPPRAAACDGVATPW